MPITCCKDCDKREINCHAYCDTYITQKQAHNKAVADFKATQIIHDVAYSATECTKISFSNYKKKRSKRQ